MKWHKVEDYPVGSDEYVLVSQIVAGQRDRAFCFAGKLNRRRNWWSNMIDDVSPCSSTDRWCHIDLPNA